MMKKILVVFTGGTIGSSVVDGWISPSDATHRELIRNYREVYGNNVLFEVLEPYSILSENLSAKNLNLLVKTVCEHVDGEYDGIIVTHGTDTLQYSASALSYALGTDSIPVVLVSSNYLLGDERANGNVNFASAVEFIEEKKGRGVFVAYRNEDKVVYFHRGGGLICHKEADDSVFSLDGKYYARSTKDGIELSGNDSEAKGMGAFPLDESSRILVISSCPGDSYNYNLSGNKAVIIKPYHSGTLDTASSALKAFCGNAKKEKVPVFVVNLKKGDTYESSKEFEELGIIPVYNSTFIGTYMRLWIAISQKEEIKGIFS